MKPWLSNAIFRTRIDPVFWQIAGGGRNTPSIGWQHPEIPHSVVGQPVHSWDDQPNASRLWTSSAPPSIHSAREPVVVTMCAKRQFKISQHLLSTHAALGSSTLQPPSVEWGGVVFRLFPRLSPELTGRRYTPFSGQI